MPTFVPSQVVDYIDERCPAAKEQCRSNGKQAFYLERPHASVVAGLLSMIDALPGRLLTLSARPLAEFVEAVEALRMAVAAWNGGEKNYVLDHLPGPVHWNPVSVIRKVLSGLADQAPALSVPALAFVEDPALRESLRVDITSADSALNSGEWKAATVLAGSVVEALLLDTLKVHEHAQPGTVIAAVSVLQQEGTLAKAAAKDLEQWDLHQLTEVASELKCITEATAQQCRLCRGFRNLVHPGRALRLAQVCDRATALSAVAAMEHVIRDLTP